MNQPDNVLVRVFPVGRYTAEFRDDRGNPSYAIHEGAVPEGVVFSGHFILNFTRVSHGLCLWADTATNRDRCLSLFFEVRADSVTEGVEEAILGIDRRFREEGLAEEKAPAHPTGNSLKPDHRRIYDSCSCGISEGDTMNQPDNILVTVSDGGYRAAIRNERGNELFNFSDMLPVDEGSFSGKFTLYFTEARAGVCLWANTATYDGGVLSLFCEVYGKDFKEAVETAIREVDSRFRETIFALEAIAPPKVPSPHPGQRLREVPFRLVREGRSFTATIEGENGTLVQEVAMPPDGPMPKWSSVAGSIWTSGDQPNVYLLRITSCDDKPRAVLPVFAKTLYEAILTLGGA